MKRILLEKLNGMALPTSFEDKDTIDSLLRKNPNGYNKSDYYSCLKWIQQTLDKNIKNKNEDITIVGRLFEVNFYDIESVEFTYHRHLIKG